MRSSSLLSTLAYMAIASTGTQERANVRRDHDWWGDRQEPVSLGRRAEKDAIALAKAEQKRARRAEKRTRKEPS